MWPDRAQTYFLNADGTNNQIRIVRRSDGAVVGSFGRSGRQAGEFHWLHSIAIDSRGNVYTAGSPAAALEHHESYLTGVLSFIGLTDITIVRAEGLALGTEAKEGAMLKARANIAAMAA